MQCTRIAREERGFSLVELLVVILIIGVLAAIAIPVFIGQRNKGFDADAKANAKNAVAAMEACYVERNRSYEGCDLSGSGLPVGSDAGQVDVAVTADGETYTVVAHSRSAAYWKVTSANGAVRRCRSDAAAGECTSGAATW